MTTIKDVAKQANVSVATVSRVLNQKGYVSKQAERSVKNAIKSLNYKPNAVARSLYHKTSGIIGLFVPDISNPFFPELARAVEDAATSEGFTVVLCNTDSKQEKEEKYIQVLQQKYADGLIIATGTDSIEHILSTNIPVVALDRYISDHIPTVVSSNKAGAIDATEHLIAQGCQFIAHLRGPKGVTSADDRYTGFKQAIEDHSIAHVVVEAGFEIGQSEVATRNLFEKYPSIDGIFAGSDVTAAGAMRAAYQCKRAVPKDVKIIGFDGISLGEMLTPSLSTIQQPIYEMGQQAAKLLMMMIEKKELPSYWHEFSTTLKIRETSTGSE
ncbi:LacI family DNA-binding transcriptional regulator [Alkalicoccobacillus murimartini]|uniref:LacI family transcriptional regulator n=1 Tax=Alkalicoccobacillus murimartini TaxID=171685 RepID=A0ABT9YLR5_9BACI|nr:LacI family DNA-binding transcriptional regulator [Alkalicoccobacillus murimartini]MDQ0208137.1 LacI family transcriptional regulator [Alkalicoccobacillus murimartini]